MYNLLIKNIYYLSAKIAPVDMTQSVSPKREHKIRENNKKTRKQSGGGTLRSSYHNYYGGNTQKRNRSGVPAGTSKNYVRDNTYY